MSLWIAATLFASLVQTLRFMLQRQIKASGLSTAAATQSRFVWAAPLAAIGVGIYARSTGQALPSVPLAFWPYALIGGIGQILATMCVVALFAHRNFAVGITFKKTEVMQTVLVALILLGEGVTLFGFLAIFIGFAGVILLSKPPQGGLSIWNRATALGLASGLFFAFAGVGYRGATLAIDSPDPLMRAGLALALVTASQAIMLGAWMMWRERDHLRAIFTRWRVTLLVGITSALGSMGWFTAFTLQNAAYVNALGQVELIFSFLVSRLVFKERASARELAGAGLIGASVVVLVLVT